MRQKDVALILNGLASGYLLGKSQLGLDCWIAFIVMGITVIWYTNKIDNERKD
jgi:Ca2+-dependent lipid-binding protein